METKEERMSMFNIKEHKKRVGDRLQKTVKLDILKEVEDYFFHQAESLGFEASYDVTAVQNPSFKTLSYTEWGTNFMVQPLNNDVRRDMILDSLLDPNSKTLRWDNYYSGVIAEKSANKYSNRRSANKVGRHSIVVPMGTNKFMDVMDIQKLIEVTKDGTSYIKPHPLTTHEYVGFMKDKCGENNVLDRDHDLYEMMVKSKKVYTTHYSESMLYAAMLGKDIDVVDKLGKHWQAAFWHFNQHILRTPKEYRIPQLNKILSSFHCGVFNPNVDNDWKSKMDLYLNYMVERREHFKGVFL